MKTILTTLVIIFMSSCVLDRAQVQRYDKYVYAPTIQDSLEARIQDKTPFPKTIDSLYWSGHYYSFRIEFPYQYTGVYYRKSFYRNHPVECMERVNNLHNKQK